MLGTVPRSNSCPSCCHQAAGNKSGKSREMVLSSVNEVIWLRQSEPRVECRASKKTKIPIGRAVQCWRKASCSDPGSWTERIALTGRTIKLAVQPAELLLEFPVGYPPGATWSLRQISEYRTSGNANCQYRSLLLLTQAGEPSEPTTTEVGAGSPGDGTLGNPGLREASSWRVP